MIVGSVNADYEPIILLGIYGANAKVHEQTLLLIKVLTVGYPYRPISLLH